MTARSRLLLDVALLAALALAASPTLTGIPLHEWISIALVVPALVHLIVNWDWTLRAVSTFFGKLRNASRLNLVVDIALFAATVTVTLTGLMISRSVAPALGFTTAPTAAWHVAHALSANATIALFLLHTALHARWLVRTFANLLADDPAPRRLPLQGGAR